MVHKTRDGCYQGKLNTEEGARFRLVLRLELATGNASGDLFDDNGFVASWRTDVEMQGTSFLFSCQRYHRKGAQLYTPASPVLKLNITAPSVDELKVALQLSKHDDHLSGILKWESHHFRRLEVNGFFFHREAREPEPFAKSHKDWQNPPHALESGNWSPQRAFEKAGIEVTFNWDKEHRPLSKRFTRDKNQKSLLWSKCELHALMAMTDPNQADLTDWQGSLLVVDGFWDGAEAPGSSIQTGEKRYGMIFDRAGEKPRQGVVLFWDRLKELYGASDSLKFKRGHCFAVVHELAHLLNITHGKETHSFSRPEPENEPNFWNQFLFSFSRDELIHLHHAYYEEIVPGGPIPYGVSLEEPRIPDGEEVTTNLLRVQPTKTSFAFMEPVTLIIGGTREDALLPPLSPSQGSVILEFKDPAGAWHTYHPPLQKHFCCHEAPAPRAPHLTDVSVFRNRFWLDQPGEYRVRAWIQEEDGTQRCSQTSSFEVEPPRRELEGMRELLEGNVALFYYLKGGDHLEGGEEGLLNVVDRFPKSELAAHAHLVLGLHALRPFKSVNGGNIKVRSADIQAAHKHLEAARKGTLPPAIESRLLQTIQQLQERNQETGH